MTSTAFSHSPMSSHWLRDRPTAEQRIPPAVDSGHVLAELFDESATGNSCEAFVLAARAPLPVAALAPYRFAVVRSGYLVRQRSTPSGRVTAIDAVGPGGCFSLSNGSASNQQAAGYAITTVSLSLCDDEALSDALRHGGQTALDIEALQADALNRLERLAEARGRSGTAGKVAALLCALADTLEPHTQRTSIPGAFLQRDLAGLLSIRHESVCRTLRDFSSRGWTERTADALVIKDRAALEPV